MTELCRSLRMLWRYWLNRIILFLYIYFSRTLSLFKKLLEIKFLPACLSVGPRQDYAPINVNPVGGGGGSAGKGWGFDKF